MDRQAIYEQVREYFSRPNAQLCKENSKDGACYYRYDWRPTMEKHYGQAPMRCVLGVLIPDHCYDSHMEGLGAEELFDRWPSLLDHIDVESERDRAWLEAMQPMHDDALSVSQFLEVLDNYAEETGLIVVQDPARDPVLIAP
jgi:hypothetical protein